jgi:hypothetical protein
LTYKESKKEQEDSEDELNKKKKGPAEFCTGSTFGKSPNVLVVSATRLSGQHAYFYFAMLLLFTP